MRSRETVAIATWMLEHLTFGSHRESLSGDLLEEFEFGRSAGWYRRQVVSAIAIGALRKSRVYALPLLFAVAWSTLYPIWWLSLVKLWSTQTIFERWASVDLPYSTSLHGIGAILPAVAFIWLGFFVYLTLQPETARQLSIPRFLVSLSISFNVLLVATIGLWAHVRYLRMGLSYVGEEEFDLNARLIALSIPLALSLLSAILFARSRRPETTSVAR